MQRNTIIGNNLGSNSFDFRNSIYKGTEPKNDPTFNRHQSKKRRISNLFFSIINYSSATLFEPQSIADIFKNYNEILKEKYNTSEDFQKSMRNSLLCFRDPASLKEQVAALKDNNPGSFIVMPVFSNIHTFSEVIRKQNGSLKFYSIDKFTSHFGGLLPTSPYAKEHIIKPGMENKLIDELNQKAFDVDTSEIVDTLKKYSSHIYNLNISHTEQKLITCLYKEPEAGIKFAFATKNLGNEDFKKLRTKNLFSNNFKIKWDNDINSTIDIHKRLLDKLKSSYRNIDLSNLDMVFKNYVQNKIFRRELKKTSNLFQSLILAFDPNNKLFDVPKRERTIELLKKLNLDSIHQVPQLKQLYSHILTPFEQMDLTKTRFNTDIFGAYCYVFSNYDLNKLLNSVNNFEKKFPIVANQAKDFHTVVNTVVAYDLFKMYIKSNNKSLSKIKESDYDWVIYKIDKAIESGPYSDKAHFSRGVLKLNRGLVLRDQNNLQKSFKEIKDAIISLKNAVILNPDSIPAKIYLLVAYKNAGLTRESNLLKEEFFKNKIDIDSNYKFTINNKKVNFDCMTKEVAKEILELKQMNKPNPMFKMSL